MSPHKLAIHNATDIAVLYCRNDGIQDTFGRFITLNQLKRYGQPIWRTNGSYWSLPIIEEGLSLGKQVQVASELIFTTAAHNPFKCTLLDLVSVDTLPLLGGFRDVTQWDLIFLQLKAHLELGGGTYIRPREVDQLISKISEHPLVDRAKFISTLDVESLCRVMARITDVRWFIAGEVSPVKLLRYFRHGPFGEKMIRHLDERYRDVVNSWYNPFYHLAWSAAEAAAQSPRDFLTRFYFVNWFKHDNVDKAILKTTKKFLVFLFYNWLDCLYPDAGNSFFDCDLFFETDYERSEWKQWLKEKR